MTYIVQTPYGTAEAPTLLQAKMIARDAARITGKAIKVEKKPEAPAPAPAIVTGSHDTPCVCGTYDRCKGIRRQDAIREGNWRAEFRAYND